MAVNNSGGEHRPRTVFRHRGSKEISRIEGFSDAVFGFAVTLLVVSLEVPKTFDELLLGMHGFVAFAAGFSILFVIWYNQNKFFRRYKLEDPLTLWLNAALLFVVLFFIYPLKFLFSTLLGHTNEAKMPDGRIEQIFKPGDQSHLMIIYGAGYLAVFLVFVLLFSHAWRKRDELELNEAERFDTATSIQQHLSQILIALCSIALAWVGQPGFSGLVYMTIGPVLTSFGFWRAHLWRKRPMPV